MTEVNVPLLRKAVEWAETEASKPEGGRWMQGTWMFQVDEFLNDMHNSFATVEDRLAWLESEHIDPTCGTAYCIAGYVAQLMNPEYRERHVIGGRHLADFATDELGISDDEADRLFAASNTIEDIRRVAEEIAGGKL